MIEKLSGDTPSSAREGSKTSLPTLTVTSPKTHPASTPMTAAMGEQWSGQPELGEERGLYLVAGSGMKTELICPPSWARILNDYLSWQHMARIPATTMKLRSYHLRRFAITAGLEPNEIGAEVLRDHIDNPDWAPGTSRSVRTTMRSFFGWALEEGVIQIDPSAKLPTIRVQAGKPRPASDDAVEAGQEAKDERVRLMVDLGSHVGLRCCEIAVVQSSDVYGLPGSYSLLVHGKGGKLRLVPVADTLAVVLLEMCGYAFPGQIDGHLSAAYVSKLISRAMHGLSTAHPLRHRFATRALRASGGNLRVVQELLGHASVATTQIYTLIENDELRRAALAA